MDSEIQLVSDGDRLVIIGERTAVEQFIATEALESRELGLPRLASIFGAGSAAAQAGSDIAANSGRWLMVTKKSALDIKKFGLAESKTPGILYAMAGRPGASKAWVQIEKGPGVLLGNPTALASLAGIMSQLAMQEAMNEILDYLAVIDAKVDDILRAQKDAVLADLGGARSVIKEGMTVWEHVERVSEVTWSKVQGTPETIDRTQDYALRQLVALTNRVERKARVDDVAKTLKGAESEVQLWLAVLADCFQLRDAVAILELDRVLDAAPEELDGHRLGLRKARQERLELITQTTGHLLARIDAAADTANARVLINPVKSPAVVHSRNRVVTAIDDFDRPLGIERARQPLSARRWLEAATDVTTGALDAATEVTGKALGTATEGADAAMRLGNETRDRALLATSEFASRIAERALRMRAHDGDRAEEG